jgi:flagellar basal body P-ring formation protein FlgA
MTRIPHMLRLTALVAATALVLAFVPAARAQSADSTLPAVPAGPTLKGAATVTGELVRIGDLIDNAGAVADVAIFRAPDPGQTGRVPASAVAEAVRSHHIIDLDTRGLTEISVTRVGRAITAKDVEARIVRALAGQYGLGDAKNMAVLFDNEVRTLQIDPTASNDLNVVRLSYEPRSSRFDVWLELPGSAAARRPPLRFTGSLTETLPAVVLARPVVQGDTLKPSDLAVERRPKAEVTDTTFTSAGQAIGLSARRALRPGQVVRQADVTRLELVARNEVVTIVYEIPGILVTVRGKALEPGAQNDMINVLNVQSKRTIQATITGPGRVSVITAAPHFASSAGSAPTQTARVEAAPASAE